MRRRTALSFAVFAAAGATLIGCAAGPAPEPERDGAAGVPTAVIPAAAVDPWVDHFTSRAAASAATAASIAQGSFGPEGGIAAIENRDETLAAGTHSVAFECAGAASVTVSTSALRPGGASASHEVACPGGATLSVVTEGEGLATSVDSHVEPGAYLIVVDGTP